MSLFVLFLHIHQVRCPIGVGRPIPIYLRFIDDKGSRNGSPGLGDGRSGFRWILHSQVLEVEIDSLIKENVTSSRGVIAKVSINVLFVNRFNILIITHDPSTSRFDHGDIMSMMGTAARVSLGRVGHNNH